MGYKGSVCLKSIALELGVSINTVSRALRDCSDISIKTKKKVRQKAIEMGYLPNNLLQTMKEESTRVIALVINKISNYYFSIMTEKLTYLLKDDGYSVVIISLFGNEFDADTVKKCIFQRVEGIISFVEPTSDSLELVKLNKIPFLMLGRKIKDKYVDDIYTDDFKGGKLAASYLYKNEAKNFIYVNVNGSECSIRRYQGFRTFLKQKGKLSKIRKINIEDFNAYLDTLDYKDTLGIFVYNDEYAYKLIKTFNSNNINMSNIKLIGFDAIGHNSDGIMKIPSIGFDYDLIAKTVSYCITTDMNKRERINMCFDVKLYI